MTKTRLALLLIGVSIVANTTYFSSAQAAAVCTRSPDAPVVTFIYPESGSGPIFTSTPAITGELATSMSIGYSALPKNRSDFDKWTNLPWIDISDVRKSFILDSNSLGLIDPSKIFVYSWAANSCGTSAPAMMPVILFTRAAQKLQVNDADYGGESIKLIPGQAEIRSDSNLPLAGVLQTPKICTVAAGVRGASNYLTVYPLSEGECKVLVSNPGTEQIESLSQVITITFAKAHQYLSVTYNGANNVVDTGSIMTEGGGVMDIVGKYPSPEMGSGHISTKDSLVSSTPGICTVRVSKDLAQFKVVGYNIFAHGQGACTLRYKSAANTQYLAADTTLKFTFKKLKQHMNVFTKNQRLWCTRVLNEVLELLDIPYKTLSGKPNVCPLGYIKDETP